MTDIPSLHDALVEAMARAYDPDAFGKYGLSPHGPEEMRRQEAKRHARAALAALSRVLTERGIKLVAREATEGMTPAYYSETHYAIPARIWALLHDAAPDMLAVKP
jgi:hypothetical protein